MECSWYPQGGVFGIVLHPTSYTPSCWLNPLSICISPLSLRELLSCNADWQADRVEKAREDKWALPHTRYIQVDLHAGEKSSCLSCWMNVFHIKTNPKGIPKHSFKQVTSTRLLISCQLVKHFGMYDKESCFHWERRSPFKHQGTPLINRLPFRHYVLFSHALNHK